MQNAVIRLENATESMAIKAKARLEALGHVNNTNSYDPRRIKEVNTVWGVDGKIYFSGVSFHDRDFNDYIVHHRATIISLGCDSEVEE